MARTSLNKDLTPLLPTVNAEMARTSHEPPRRPKQRGFRARLYTVMTMDEPMISAAITSAMASRLAERSIWSPTR